MYVAGTVSVLVAAKEWVPAVDGGVLFGQWRYPGFRGWSTPLDADPSDGSGSGGGSAVLRSDGVVGESGEEGSVKGGSVTGKVNWG